MFKRRLIVACRPLGLAIFWIGLAMVLGRNWWLLPVPLIGICLRAYARWWDNGLLYPALWQSLALHAVLGVAMAAAAATMSDEDLVQSMAYFGFWLIGLWFAGKCIVRFLLALYKQNDLHA